MEIQNKIGEQVFDKLRSKFKQITLGDAEGNSTQDPQEAVFFNFNYTDKEGHDHGNITVSLIDRTMKIYYSKNISSDLPGSELTEWYAFLQDMRKTAKSNLYGFDAHDISKSALNVSDIQSTITRNDVAEGKMYGSKKRSYQECGPAKILVRHTENIDATKHGARSRKIESVFVETFEGERFKMPFESLPGTRAMAQHIGHGGRPHDDIGESITTMVNEIIGLRPFVSRNRNAIYEDETTMQMVEAAKEYYAETRKSLGKLKGKRGYKAYAESFEVTEQQTFEDDDAAAMKDRFTKKRFNDKMEGAMPIVHKAYNRKNMKPKSPIMKSPSPITEFEEWTEDVTEMPAAPIIEDSLDEVKATPAQQQRKTQHRASARVGHKKRMRDTLSKVFKRPESIGDINQRKNDEIAADPKLQKRFGWNTDGEHLGGDELDEGVEMCSEECCGKPVTECHCGPECPHCDCHAKNALKESNRHTTFGPNYNPKMRYTDSRAPSPGDSVMTPDGKGVVVDNSQNNDGYYVFFDVELVDGENDGIVQKYHISAVKTNVDEGRPKTKSQDKYTVYKDKKIIKNNMTRAAAMKLAKEKGYEYGSSSFVHDKLNEGTWALPDNPGKKAKLKELMSSPLPYGTDGDNASSALYDLLGDDQLFDLLYADAQSFGAEADARDTVKYWISTRKDKGWSDDDMRHFGESKVREDVILPKATYSDYLEVADMGFDDAGDEHQDADSMVKALKKNGKRGDHKSAMGALKRMGEQKAKSGLHSINESIQRLKRDAGIIK